MIRHLWPLLAGFTLWALAFILLYALQYLGCYFGWAPAAHRTALVVGYVMSIAALAGALLVQLALLRRRGPPPRPWPPPPLPSARPSWHPPASRQMPAFCCVHICRKACCSAVAAPLGSRA
jgi:hypothetical protein